MSGQTPHGTAANNNANNAASNNTPSSTAGSASASWRPARAHLAVDDGMSTESDAESSYHGWSDAGW
jgi:hypothetical protein